MNRLIATAFVFGMMVGRRQCDADGAARARNQRRRHRGRRRMRPWLAPRPLWRLPPQLRPALRCTPARAAGTPAPTAVAARTGGEVLIVIAWT